MVTPPTDRPNQIAALLLRIGEMLPNHFRAAEIRSLEDAIYDELVGDGEPIDVAYATAFLAHVEAQQAALDADRRAAWTPERLVRTALAIRDRAERRPNREARRPTRTTRTTRTRRIRSRPALANAPPDEPRRLETAPAGLDDPGAAAAVLGQRSSIARRFDRLCGWNLGRAGADDCLNDLEASS